MANSQLHLGRAALLASLSVAGVLFWDSPVLLPLKLLAVMGHETGHALASLVVGGTVERVTLKLDESGACLSRVPLGFFAQGAVFSAGYLGSALISVLLLMCSFRFNARRLSLAAACVWLSVMGLFYARDIFTLLFCAVMASLFGFGARWLPQSAVAALNLVIASFTALYAAMDLKDDLWNSEVRAQSDAALLANVTFIPAVVWAALWTVLSLMILLAGLRFALSERVLERAAQSPARPSD